MLTRITYASTVTAGHGHVDFLEIVESAQRTNDAMEIGGVIAFDGFQFIQIIEGEEDVVSPLFARISADRRNDGVVEIRHQGVTVRHFRDWTMRKIPLVNVLMLSATLNDESAASKQAGGELMSIAIRLHMSLATMAMARPVSLAPSHP